MKAIVISTHTVGSFIGSSSVSGIDQDNGNYTIRLIKNGIKVEVSYISANSSSNPNEENSSDTNTDPNTSENTDPNSNENTDTNENSNEDNSTNTDPNTNENTDPNTDPSEDTTPSTGVFPDITIIGWVL